MRMGRTRRLTAVAGAVLVGVLGPGLAPAVAQQAPTGGLTAGVPPRWDGARINDNPNPGPSVGAEGWTLKPPTTQCVTSFKKATISEFPLGQPWLRLDEAHRWATGKGQTVAVIDTGVNDHQYIKVTKSGDYLGQTPGLGPGKRDCDGHGTEVAGIIAAHPDNTKVGFQGVAPDANIMSVRQSSSVIKRSKENQEATAGSPTTLAYAIKWAVSQGASVINISLASCLQVSPNMSFTSDQKQLQAAIHEAVENKVVIVAAAGNLQQQGQNCGTQNDNPDPNAPKWIESPAWFAEDVLSVAALAADSSNGEQVGQPASFSMWGPWVGVAAPGTKIISLDPGSTDGMANQTIEGGQTQSIQGTSFAAPYVAGLAALVKEKFPNLDAHQVIRRIEMTAQHPAAPGGRNNQVGYGMIDPVAALTAIVPGEPGGPQVASGQQIASDLGSPADNGLPPMVIAMLGTAAGVVLLLITLFVVHAVNTSKRRQAVQPSRLRI
ncbi:type VII secretion system ESX-1 serine protease mycosin MycP1 [Kutzneria viridogrisea]